jgi:choline monooxygenase
MTTALKFRPDPDRSATLPASYYIDPAIYEREKEAIFFRTWQFVGFAFDLAQPGDYITADILDQKILVVRGKDKKLRAFYNVCMHRGHVLAAGKGNKAIFTCPFHAWSYDATGALKAAGNAENVKGFRLEEFGLAEIKVETLGPLVLVNLDPTAASLADQAKGLAEHWRANVKFFDRLRFRYRQDYQVKCNWKLIADQNECYHCPAIHAGVTTVQGGPAAWITTEHAIWSTHLIRANDEVTQSRLAALKAPHDPDTWQNEAFIWYLWPNLIFVTHQAPTNFKILHFLPTGVESSVETLYCFTLDPPTADDQANIERFATVVQGQDLDAMKKQQTGLHARGYKLGRLMVDKERSWRSEHSVHHFDKMVWEALNGPNY